MNFYKAKTLLSLKNNSLKNKKIINKKLARIKS